MEIGTVALMTATLTPFTLRVTRAIKAELARRDLGGADLIPVLQIGKNAVYARLRGEKSFEVDEVAKVAAYLGIEVEDLFKQPRRLAIPEVAA